MLSSILLSEEEISAMRKELEKYGIQMPAFSKIGGILASEVWFDAWRFGLLVMVADHADHLNDDKSL